MRQAVAAACEPVLRTVANNVLQQKSFAAMYSCKHCHHMGSVFMMHEEEV